MPLAVVTGANRGIGLTLVKRLRRTGYEVAACCRAPSDARDLAAFADEAGGVAIHALDVTDDAAALGVAAGMADRSVDLLVANAGVFGGSRQTFAGFSAPDFLHTLNVNTVGVARTIEAFLPLVEKGAEKKIAAVSSGMGGVAEAGGGYYAYRASKAALNMLVRAAAQDLAGRGIVALALCPGWVRTDMGGPHAAVSPEESAQGLVDVIRGAGPAESGRFIRYNGERLAW